jgi:hypothetical protein
MEERFALTRSRRHHSVRRANCDFRTTPLSNLNGGAGSCVGNRTVGRRLLGEEARPGSTGLCQLIVAVLRSKTMSGGHRGYSLMYRLCLKPWEFDATPSQLVQVADQLPPGRALEFGCGTGRQTVELAQRGWEVTGVDYVRRAIEESRTRAEAAAVEAQFIESVRWALSVQEYTRAPMAAPDGRQYAGTARRHAAEGHGDRIKVKSPKGEGAEVDLNERGRSELKQ